MTKPQREPTRTLARVHNAKLKPPPDRRKGASSATLHHCSSTLPRARTTHLVQTRWMDGWMSGWIVSLYEVTTLLYAHSAASVSVLVPP